MARPWVGRDSQRSRVYAAERYAAEHDGRGASYECHWLFDRIAANDVQSYVDSVVRSSWWRLSYIPPEGGPLTIRDQLARVPTKIVVQQTLRDNLRGWALNDPILYYGRYVPAIKLGKPSIGSVPRWLILHEICHIATQADPGHGRDFARVYLSAVKRFIGDEAAGLLRAGYKEHGVKYTRTNSREKAA